MKVVVRYSENSPICLLQWVTTSMILDESLEYLQAQYHMQFIEIPNYTRWLLLSRNGTQTMMGAYGAKWRMEPLSTRTKLDNYECEGQLSIFDFIERPESIEDHLPCDTCGHDVKGCCDYDYNQKH